MKKDELTDIEKFCVHAILFNSDSNFLDLAYRLTRKKEPTADDPGIVHKMALRWLREDERINDYIRACGYEAYIDSSGLKRFCIRLDDDDYKIK